MRMKFHPSSRKANQQGIALALVLIMSAIALAILASVMAWSATSARQTHRSIQYTRSVAAAEAATEKVVGQLEHDFLNGGEGLVTRNLASYRLNTIPSSADSPYWNQWKFDDGNGNMGQTYIQRTPGNNYVVLDSIYAGLSGYVSTYTVVSHASDTANPQQVNAGVLQQLQLTGIPIFQFMMYSSGDMEVSCGQPFNVTGRVHANGNLYVEPDSTLTFEAGVNAALQVLFQRAPNDSRGAPAGSVVYALSGQPISGVDPLTLPIGASNSPTAIREIIEPPPPGEDPSSALGQSRYYNQCDMIIADSSNGISITTSSGLVVPSNQVPVFVADTNSFYDARENKTVQPIDINVGSLAAWSQTNNTIRNPSSIYVVDNRSLPATSLSAVRVKNGMTLPPNGLTVVTGHPLYVQGDYNELNATNLGTTNTTTTLPASLVGDAITILSDAWQDGKSTLDISQRGAASTTVNAAFLTGVVETANGNYSGGMENFPRFLENWGAANIFTYNGSMVKMFPSLYATNIWGEGNVYNPPARNWAYDLNFDDPTKLPPKTPSLLKVIRGQWATVPPGKNVATTLQ
jgi:hypothetical protein